MSLGGEVAHSALLAVLICADGDRDDVRPGPKTRPTCTLLGKATMNHWPYAQSGQEACLGTVERQVFWLQGAILPAGQTESLDSFIGCCSLRPRTGSIDRLVKALLSESVFTTRLEQRKVSDLATPEST